MATRIEKIIATARLTLADPNKERWPDETLIAIINEAQQDFCLQTRMLHARVDVPITQGKADFTMPSDCWLLTRLLYNNKKLPLKSHQELDRHLTSQWEEDEGKPQAYLYDKCDAQVGKLYPIPDEALDESIYEYADSAFGVTTEMTDYTFDGQFGVFSELADADFVNVQEDLFGFLGAIVEQFTWVKAYYLRYPTEIVDVNSELSIPVTSDIALKYYLCGQAFMNDIDGQYQQKGAVQMAVYDRHVLVAKKDTAKGFTQASQFETQYRSF